MEFEQAVPMKIEVKDPSPELAMVVGIKRGFDKAVEMTNFWLRNRLNIAEEQWYIHVHGFDSDRREQMFEEYKKFMEEHFNEICYGSKEKESNRGSGGND